MTLQAGSIAVLGATGKTGRAVIRALRRRGAFVRAVVRQPVPAGDERIGGADEVAVADLRDPDATDAALTDAGGVYLVAPNMSDDEPAMMGAIIDGCVRRRTPRVVYHSVLHPYAPAMPHHRDKAEVEARLHETDLDWTIVQPASYLENVHGVWDSLLAGDWPLPYPGSARFTPVALDDVADAAARVLTEFGHAHAGYELAGPQDLSTAEQAEQAAVVLGRPVTLRQVEPAAGTPPRLQAMFDYYARSGLRGNPRTLAQLLGRTPTSWQQWLRARTLDS